MSFETPSRWFIPGAEEAIKVLDSRATFSPRTAFFNHRAVEALLAWNLAAELTPNRDTGCFPSALAFTHGIETLQALDISPATTDSNAIFIISHKVASRSRQRRTQLVSSRLTLPETRSFLENSLKSLWVITIRSRGLGHMLAALAIEDCPNFFLWDTSSNPPAYQRAGISRENLEVVSPVGLFHHIKLHHAFRSEPVALIGFS